jgi:hypothetical protein
VLLVAVLASLVGIALMMAVTRAERLFARLRVSPALKPAIGGIAVGMLAWSFPQVLSSGHGALESTLYALLSTPLPLRDMAMVLLFKSAASAISIGCGFRGGLLSRPLFPATAQHGWYVLDPPRNETASRRNYCLFNYPISADKQTVRNVNCKRLRGVEIDDQFKLGGMNDGHIGGLLSLKNPASIGALQPV